jgi:short-subunit dehydrogenase
MKLSYKDQRILITGASAGIGLAMARQLAPEAKALVLTARRESLLEALKNELMLAYPQLEILVCPCDLSDTRSIDELLHYISQELGAVDIVINNAGMGDYGLFEEASWHKLEAMLRLNIEGLTYLTHQLVPAMVLLGRGGVLNVSSGLGLFFMPGMAVYAATKHYVTAFTEALRAELHGTGVVVSQLCPGPVYTEFSEVAGNRALEQRVPAGVALTAEQCAREALSGFRLGKALIVPGTVIRTLTTLGRLMPRPLQRWVFRGARPMLQRQQAAQAAPEPVEAY